VPPGAPRRRATAPYARTLLHHAERGLTWHFSFSPAECGVSKALSVKGIIPDALRRIVPPHCAC
jgi:hypothetical protein